MLVRVNNAVHLLCMLSRQPHKQHLQPYYSFDDTAAALHTKAELTSLIEADRLDSHLKQGATQDCMCLTLGKDLCSTDKMNVWMIRLHLCKLVCPSTWRTSWLQPHVAELVCPIVVGPSVGRQLACRHICCH